MAFTFFIALLVFGAESIPEIARGLSKAIRFFKDASSSIKEEISNTAKKNGLDSNLTQQIQNEMNKIKDELEGMAGNFKGKV